MLRQHLKHFVHDKCTETNQIESLQGGKTKSKKGGNIRMIFHSHCQVDERRMPLRHSNSLLYYYLLFCPLFLSLWTVYTIHVLIIVVRIAKTQIATQNSILACTYTQKHRGIEKYSNSHTNILSMIHCHSLLFEKIYVLMGVCVCVLK